VVGFQRNSEAAKQIRKAPTDEAAAQKALWRYERRRAFWKFGFRYSFAFNGKRAQNKVRLTVSVVFDHIACARVGEYRPLRGFWAIFLSVQQMPRDAESGC
jgi:hypothetical protein